MGFSLLAATIPDVTVFAIAATLIGVGAIGVVTSANPVHAALSLILTLFGVAVLFVEADADFLAAVQVIVYAGAVVVLFLFVIMFLGIDKSENLTTEPLVGQRVLAYLSAAIVFVAIYLMLDRSHWVTGAHTVAGAPTTPGHPVGTAIGKSLFTTYLLAFEATAGLLVIAVVGAVILARRPASSTSDTAVPSEVGEDEGDIERPDEEPIDGADEPANESAEVGS